MREATPPLAECVTAFLDDLLLEGKSPATVRVYRIQLRHLPDWPLTEQTIRTVIAARLRVSTGTAKLCRAAISSFVAYCLMRGWLVTSPLAHVPKVRVKPPPHRYLTREQVQAVYAACLTDQERLIVRLLLLGLRAAELLSLHHKHLSGDVLTVTGKGGKHRTLPVDADTVDLMPPGRLVPMTYGTLSTRIQALGRRAGVPWLRCHDFRRTMATHYMLETGDPLTLQQLGGWAGMEMVAHYARSALEASAVSKARTVNLTGRLLRE